MLRIVWTYEVKPDRIEEFVRHYHRDGTWARFFARDPAYRGTVLSRDADAPARFVTVDSWDDRESYDRFRDENREEYASLDAGFDELTLQEDLVGFFLDTDAA